MTTDFPPPRRSPRRSAWALAVAVAIVGVLLLAVPRIGREIVAPLPSALPSLAMPSPPASSVNPEANVLLAVGDIGNCDGTHDEDVAALAASLPGTIALLGDLAYPDGSTSNFKNCFAPAWSKLLPRLRPAPGNHEYQTSHADPYFAFFGPVAGTPHQGWYSYDVGSWHIVVLNSNCAAVGGCDRGSAQMRWLAKDLATTATGSVVFPAPCILAYWHHPRYSSGLHGDDPMTDALWQTLAINHATLVLSGHDHDYERFAPRDGIREFVVGTGGRSLYAWPGAPEKASEIRNNKSYGLLKLTLHESGYDWQFVPAAGSTFTDSGSGTCSS